MGELIVAELHMSRIDAISGPTVEILTLLVVVRRRALGDVSGAREA